MNFAAVSLVGESVADPQRCYINTMHGVDAAAKSCARPAGHMKAAFSAMTVKTDRKDARGIAQLLRMGWYRPVVGRKMEHQAVVSLIEIGDISAEE
jgi:hypothetical protein